MVDCGLFQGRILRGRASPSYCISEAGVQKLPDIGYSSLYSVHVMQKWSRGKFNWCIYMKKGVWRVQPMGGCRLLYFVKGFAKMTPNLEGGKLSTNLKLLKHPPDDKGSGTPKPQNYYRVSVSVDASSSLED